MKFSQAGGELMAKISVASEKDQHILFEQYKILIESINKMNDTREGSNNFWTGVNGFGISIIAYFREAPNIPASHKTMFLSTVIAVGILFCFIWLGFMATIKKSIVKNSKILVEVEEKFPLAIFSNSYIRKGEKAGKPALTSIEMFVPLLFIGGYIFFAILLIFFPAEIFAN
jgi:hypothetical protein